MTTLAVIPARHASTRLPGKPLLRETGRFLIQHVVERVCQARQIDEVIVATDDDRILEAVTGFGGTAVMTASHHRTGTDRVAEVAAGRTDADIIVNVQGDEPDIRIDGLDRLVAAFREPDCPDMGTLATPFPPGTDPADPHAVKVVCDRYGRAMYFSRAPIPYPRHADGGAPVLLHLGVYAWRRETLLRLAALPPTPLEQTESLEQLRALENGMRLRVIEVAEPARGIDTPEDYAAFVERWKAEHR